MKKIILFCTVLLLFAILVHAKEPYHCDNIEGLRGLCFDVTFAVTTDREMNIPAKYNFPHFVRAGDYLFIKNITIYNLGEENSTSGQFVLNIRPIDYVDAPYTDLKKIYPENYGDFRYEVKSLPPNYYCEYSFDYFEGYYKTNCKSDSVRLDRYYIELFKQGEWVIVDDFEPSEPTLPSKKGVGVVVQYDHTSIFNGKWKGNTFRVTSGFEMDNFKDLKSSLKLILISMIITIFLSLYPTYFSYRNLNKEKQKKDRFVIWIYWILLIIIILSLIILLKVYY